MHQKKIPVFLGLLIVLAGLIGSVYLVETGFSLFPQAEPKLSPQSVRITNVGADKFTVSWETQTQTSGFIKYGNSPSLNLVGLDDRDQISGEIGHYFLHHVTLSSLEPSQDYYFKIGSGKNLFDNQGKAFQLKTAPALGNLPLADPAYGRVVKKDGQPFVGAIVYLKVANSQSLSCLTDTSGYWLIPKNMARSEDLLSWTQYHPDDLEEIAVQGGPEGTTVKVVSPDEDSPAAEITLSQLTSKLNILDSGDYILPAFSSSPSGEISPTPTTTPTPTVLPTPSPTLSPEEVPQPGYWLPSVFLVIVGLVLISGGFVLVKI